MKKSVILSALLSLTLLSGCGSSAPAKIGDENNTIQSVKKYALKGNSEVDIKNLKTSNTSSMNSDITVSCDPNEQVSYITLKTDAGTNVLYIEKDHFLIKDGDKYDDMTLEFQDSGFRYVFSLDTNLTYGNPYLTASTYEGITPTSESKSIMTINGNTYNGTEKVYEGDDLLSDVFKEEAENVLKKRNETNTLKELRAASSGKTLSDKQKQTKVDELEKQYKKANSNALSLVTVKNVKITVFQDEEDNILSADVSADVTLNDAYTMEFKSNYEITSIGDETDVPLIDESSISTLSGDVRTALTSSFK